MITGSADGSEGPTRRPIVFPVSFRVTVGPDEWDLEHGSGTLPEAVRDDVTDRLHSWLSAAVTGIGGILQIELAPGVCTCGDNDEHGRTAAED